LEKHLTISGACFFIIFLAEKFYFLILFMFSCQTVAVFIFICDENLISVIRVPAGPEKSGNASFDFLSPAKS